MDVVLIICLFRGYFFNASGWKCPVRQGEGPVWPGKTKYCCGRKENTILKIIPGCGEKGSLLLK